MNDLQTFSPATRLSEDTIALLRSVPILASLDDSGLHCLDGAAERWIDAGEMLVAMGEQTHDFWILLEGTMRLYYIIEGNKEQTGHVYQPGASFGEVPLLGSSSAGQRPRARQYPGQ
jgi:CRP-like cAMP-binding protein